MQKPYRSKVVLDVTHQGRRYHSFDAPNRTTLKINQFNNSQKNNNRDDHNKNKIININGKKSVQEKIRSFSTVETKNEIAPRASLLKYEVKKWIETSSSRRTSLERKESWIKERKQSTLNNIVEETPVPSQVNGGRKPKEGNMPPEKCIYCIEYEKQIENLQNEILDEKDKSEVALLQLEQKLEETLKQKNDLQKDIKKLQKQVRKIENQLEEEEIQNRRLGIKLEDANYEINRLRQELITSQLENEKIIEENEDLAVDNEDLIKDRDEIVQIYDELYRESERLKHEVKIWKSVVECNKENLTNGMDDINNNLQNEVDGKSDINSSDEDEGVVIEIEEDQSLLLPPREDVKIKTTEPSKVFEMIEEIGRGKFGKVYKAMARSSGDMYAAKYVKVTSKLRQDAMNTIEIMKKLHHVRLMNLFDVYDLGSQLVIILEYVSIVDFEQVNVSRVVTRCISFSVGGGRLFERILQNKHLTEANCVIYIKQILQGLHHLHARNICHLDIKPENIVCTNKDSMDIKLIDFGYAKQLEHKKDIKITAGSPEFVAPEILSFDPVSLACDMWSLGVVTYILTPPGDCFYILLSGISPFVGDDNNDTLMNVSCGEFEYDETAFKNITNDAKEFINMLLVSQPKKRGTVSKALNHQWMKLNPASKHIVIDLTNIKNFLEKHKDTGNVSATRAIRRFSSFGVGALKPPQGGMRLGAHSGSRHLLVPNAIQSATISEDGEDVSQVEERTFGVNMPTVRITRDSCDSVEENPVKVTRRNRSTLKSNHHKNERVRDSLKSIGSTDEELEIDIPEDTGTPDGLRQYLQRMITEGHLPGSQGPPQMYIEASDDER